MDGTLLETRVDARSQYETKVLSFLPRISRGVPISTTFSEAATYAILHLGAVYLGGSHATLGWVESDKPLRLPELSQWPIKDHRGTSVSGCLPLDNPTYRLLGFENIILSTFRVRTPSDRELRALTPENSALDNTATRPA